MSYDSLLFFQLYILANMWSEIEKAFIIISFACFL